MGTSKIFEIQKTPKPSPVSTTRPHHQPQGWDGTPSTFNGRKGCPVRSAENNHSENGGVIGLIHSSLVTFHYQHFSMPV